MKGERDMNSCAGFAAYDGGMQDLDAAARRAQTDARAAVDALPWLAEAIARDAEAGSFAAWGPSTVIDENTGAPVIGDELFGELHRRAGLPARWPVGNAGLIHCYGYLLSLAQTPYGLKRDRWLTPELARAYGLPDDAFAPDAPGPTLLTRAAVAMARALDTEDGVDIDADGVPTRLRFVHGPSESAVAYAVDGCLITTFPVADADTMRAEIEADEPRLRWNAVDPRAGARSATFD